MVLKVEQGIISIAQILRNSIRNRYGLVSVPQRLTLIPQSFNISPIPEYILTNAQNQDKQSASVVLLESLCFSTI